MADGGSFLSRGVEFVREYLQDSLEGARWTDARIVTLLSLANRLTFGDMVSCRPPGSPFQYDEMDLTITADKVWYDLPGNFRKFLRLVKLDNQRKVVGEILQTDPLSGIPGIIIYDQRKGFELWPTPTTTISDTRTENSVSKSAWCFQYESGVVNHLCEVTASGTPTSTTIPLGGTALYGVASSVNSFYVGSWVHCTAGTNIGYVGRVTAYTGSTKTITVSPAGSSAFTTSSVIEVLPCLSEPLDHAIMWRAVMSIWASNTNERGYEMAKKEYQDILEEAGFTLADNTSRTGPAMGSSFLDRTMEVSYG